MTMAEAQHFLPPAQQEVKKQVQKAVQAQLVNLNEQRAKALLLSLRAQVDQIVSEK